MNHSGWPFSAGPLVGRLWALTALLANTNAVAPQPAKSHLPHASLFCRSTFDIFCPLG
jgi:hypothetical protein